jgi:hypothetical protein
MTKTATLFTNWPAMHVIRLKIREWITADENATGVMTFENGSMVQFPSINLPPTKVTIDWSAIRTYLAGNGDIGTVAQCVARSSSNGNVLTINLGAEPVVMENGQIIAKSMKATAQVVLANGDVWTSAGIAQPQGYGCFPDCPFVNGVAQAVVATFLMAKK